MAVGKGYGEEDRGCLTLQCRHWQREGEGSSSSAIFLAGSNSPHALGSSLGVTLAGVGGTVHVLSRGQVQAQGVGSQLLTEHRPLGDLGGNGVKPGPGLKEEQRGPFVTV